MSIREDGGGITIAISDNGIGFDPAETRPGHMRTMRDRAAAICGELSVESAGYGHGATVRLTLARSR